jgi:hypothetical protein
MKTTSQPWWSRVIRPAWQSRSVLFVRLAVGLIFLTQGILKYIDLNMGVSRFTRIGFRSDLKKWRENPSQRVR